MTLITSVAPDLTWLKDVALPQPELSGPVQLPPAVQGTGGEKLVLDNGSDPFALAVGDVGIVHRGSLPGQLAAYPSETILDWAVRTFFLTRLPRDATFMSLDGLARWCDLPEAEWITCPRCKGKRVEPGAQTHEDGARLACRECGGAGEVQDRADGLAELGPVKVDRRDLQAVVPHLRGDKVALFVAPAVYQPGLQAHVRHLVRRNATELLDGDWRIVMEPVHTLLQ